MGSIKRVSHQPGRAKRRLYFRLQHWMWRKRWEERCSFRKFKTKRQVCRTSSGPHLILKKQLKKNKRRCPRRRTHNHTSAAVSLPACATEVSENIRGWQKSLLKPCESDGVSGTFIDSSYLENHVTDTQVAAVNTVSNTVPMATETFVQGCETADASEHSWTVIETDACGNITQVPRKAIPLQRLEVESPSGQHTVPTGEDQALNTDTEERIPSIESSKAASLADVVKDIHGFLNDFYRTYGSFIPLQRSDVLRHLKRTFNEDFSDWKHAIISEVTKYQSVIVQDPVPFFQVVYKKHTLTLEDLLTLADQNWLNDQVMNMYGELIMASARQEVHFLNSFFHRQLMTKGYDGVKRWTKQVDLFSKSLLLVPIHLEVHWCLVTADIVQKRICLYDSQGNALQKVARNILKYLITMAKEKQQTAFENGWTVSYNEKIPQQTNENDCGVFVLEYCRCLALSKPLQFSQSDIPKIRKRIYKELCECRLHEEG